MKTVLSITMLFFVFTSYGQEKFKISEKKINQESFFSCCQRNKEFIKLTHGASKRNIEAIFTYWEQSGYTDKRWIAYILATIYRETMGTMEPIREGNSKSNKEAIIAVGNLVKKRNKDNLKNNKPLMKDYSIPDKNGNSFYGRGFIQLTGSENYKKIGNKIGMGSLLFKKPDTVLSLNISTKIAVEGMVKGWYTKDKTTKRPNSLGEFFNNTLEDWVLARNIINPGTTLKRKKITAKIAKKFYACLGDD